MKSYDVIIVGRGFAALSTAWHLKRLGIRRICLIGPTPTQDNCHSMLASCAFASLHDNITRAVHNLGPEVAKDLMFLARCGLFELTNHLERWSIDRALGQVIRLGLSEHETQEMKIATNWLSQNGYPAHHVEKPSFQKNCDSIQFDGAASISFDSDALMKRLETNSACDVWPTDVILAEQLGNSMRLKTSNGQIFESELAVLACHQGIKSLLPILAPTLVNHADQSVEFDIQSGHLHTNQGDHVIAGHGQLWFTHSHKNKLRAGGARFMRPWAGVEATEATASPAISLNIKQTIEKLLGVKLSRPKSAVGFIELLACDELPIIGPMFGNSRFLIASGFMNSSLSFRLAAGRGLAEFITQGRSSTVSDSFLPRRLRSLPESS